MAGGDLRKFLMPSGPAGFGVAVAAVALASAIGLPFRAVTDPDNLTMVYFTAVVVIALRYGFGPALLSAVLSVALFNFLFTPPYYTFEALNPASYLTFGIMLVSSLLAALLASGLAARLAFASREQTETRLLLDVAQELLKAGSREEVEASLARHLAARLGGRAVLISAGDASPPRNGPQGITLPLSAGPEDLGQLKVERPEDAPPLSEGDRLELETIAALAAGALLRIRQGEFAARARADEQSERLRNLLLSSLGHDLRTPLTVLSGTVSGLLRMRRKLPREAMEEVTLLSRQIADLQKFTGNLLRMASISSGKLKLNREPYDFKEILGVALKRIEELREERQVRIEVNGALPLVDIDGALVEQVLVNLLENAIRHTEPHGVIAIRLERRGSFLKTTISDDGPGLPPGEEEAVFERFRTGLEGQSDRKHGGHGLGLAICRGIVEAHGGHIEARNRADGPGASFTFTLPFAEPIAGAPA